MYAAAKAKAAALQSYSSPPQAHLSPTCSLIGRTSSIPLPEELASLSGPGSGGSGGSGGAECVGGAQRSREVHSFLGVPFAKPPVGARKFKDPEPLPLWTGTRQATEFGAACPQDFTILDSYPFKVERPTSVSEDCLFLNVWTPSLLRDAKLPVMVFIHGGGFILGYADFFAGDALSALHDVVYVGINYRLGLWGFLCTGDSAATGNFGLLDQIEALRWVQKHIEHFGGDPTNVTIFGESAGGMSVNYLLLSPLARGLFTRAISESGTSLTMGDLQTPQQASLALKPFLKHVGCTAENSEDIVAFLHALPPEKLIMPQALVNVISLRPVIDGRFLLATPRDLYAKGDFPKVSYLLGCNHDEGTFLFMGMAKAQGHDLTQFPVEMAKGYLRGALAMAFKGQDVTSLVEACWEEYMGGVEDSAEGRQRALVGLLGDLYFVHPTVSVASAHAAAGDVFVYSFERRSAFVKEQDAPAWVRADHAWELLSVFGIPFYTPSVNFSAEDRALSLSMMNYWTNFAKNGNPNGPGLEEWLRYSADTKQHLVLDTPIRQSSNLRALRVRFWAETAPGLLKKQTPPTSSPPA